jgi:hypothetical protein
LKFGCFEIGLIFVFVLTDVRHALARPPHYIIHNCWTEMLARSLGHIIILVHFRLFFDCFCHLGSNFEALESVLLIFFLGFASKKYDQTDSRAPKCLPRVTKTVMYIVKTKNYRTFKNQIKDVYCF